jgi:dTMP kinase
MAKDTRSCEVSRVRAYGKDRFPGRLFIVEGIDGSGKSTQLALLQKWLESEGYGTFFSEWNMSLFYATDFADRLENEMIPALRAGFIVLTDRYIYSLMARATIRGADPQWVKGVYEFALKPDIVVYLRATVDELTTRVVQTSGFNYWESGMDLRLGEDMFDSFTAYQGRLLDVFDTMAGEYAFHVVDSSASIQNVSEQIKSLLEPLLITV